MNRKIRLLARSALGTRCDVPVVMLSVWTRRGTYVALPFLVDTGADCAALSLSLAEHEAIPFQRTEETRGRVVGVVGSVERFRGALHVQIAGERFHWPCFFVDSAVAPTLSPELSGTDYGILGRAGFLSEFAFCLDDKALTVRRRWPSRPWWYRAARRLAAPLPRSHDPSEPL